MFVRTITAAALTGLALAPVALSAKPEPGAFTLTLSAQPNPVVFSTPATATGKNYNKVSTEFFNTVHQVLSKRAEPARALSSLDRDLKRIKRNGWQ